MFKKLFFMSFVLLWTTSFLSETTSAQTNLVGRWKFDEESGTIAADSSGNGNDGTLVGDPQWVVGQINGALEFDGNGDYVNCGSAPILQVQNQITLACWFKVTAFTRNWATIISMGDDSYRIGRGESNYSMHFGFNGAVSSPYSWFDGRKRVNDEQWHHIAGVYDGTEARIYIDGELDASQPATGQINISSYPLYIGENAQATGRFWNGLVDDVRIYNRALSEKEIQVVMTGVDETPALAYEPNPADEAIDVSRDVILSWSPGEFADKHDVYLGTNSDSVENANRTDQLSALFSQGQDSNTLNPGRLEFGQTYYWRIDEVNAPPDSTIHKGKVWSFTVEQLAYQIPTESITATASSQAEDQGPEKTVDGSGLVNDKHSISIEDMWLTASDEPGPTWIQYQFDKTCKLHEMLVWNYNGPYILIGSGCKDVTIEYSTDGESWTQLDNVPEFAQASGNINYTYNTIVNFNGAAAKYVKITANSNWNSALFHQFGLSEVRFMQIPASASNPIPEDEATDVEVDVILSWRAGRGAVEHNVYLSTDQQAVIDGTASAVTVTNASYGPLSLDLEGTYYWQVEEVNNNEATPIWKSDIWSFSTQEYIIVDDFESYNDIEQGEEGSNLVYDTWTDGYEDSANGSTMGYLTVPSLETTIFHGGIQSVPITYDNTTASSSVVTVNPAELSIGRDWTEGAPETLVLWFYGNLNNAVTEQMYVMINNAKVVYPDTDNLMRERWNQWSIDLISLGIDLSNISTFSIGFERTGTTGGTGTVLIDDIRLYKTPPPEIEPVDPGNDALVAHYAFDNNTEDSSGNGHHGTVVGNPSFVTGVTGMALALDGVDDYVDCGNNASFDITEEITLAAWINTNDTGNDENNPYVGKGDRAYAIKHSSANVIQFFIYDGSWLTANTNVDDSFNGIWHHVAGTYDGSELKLYVDGTLRATTIYVGTIDVRTNNLTIGTNSEVSGRFYDGAIDDARIYNRALSEAEILYLAGE
jgi:hypothetical protein